jgi:YD repeat-containing protein
MLSLQYSLVDKKLHISQSWKPLRIFIITIVVFAGIRNSCSQSITNKDVGLPEYGTFSAGSVDSIQLDNTNLHIEIPLVTIPQRGKLDVSYKLIYDSRSFTIRSVCPPKGNSCIYTVGPSGDFALHLVGPKSVTAGYTPTTTCSPSGTVGSAVMSSDYYIVDQHNTIHSIPSLLTYCCNYPAGTGPFTTGLADDGSGWALTIDRAGNPFSIKDINGTSYPADISRTYPRVIAEDSNGNELILPTSTSSTFTDTLGRFQPIVSSGTAMPSGFTFYDANGVQQTVQFTYTSVPVNTALCQFSGAQSSDICRELAPTKNALSAVTLPDGRSYSIMYVQNSYGQPSSITLPDGGVVSWTWAAPYDKEGPVVTSRTVNDGATSYTWTYTRQADRTVTTYPNGDTETDVFTYLALPFPFQAVVPVTTSSIIATAASHLIKSTQTDYDTSGASGYLPVRETVHWYDSGLYSKKETDWTTQGSDVLSLPKNQRYYGFGAGAPGGLLKTVSTSYLFQNNSAYLSSNVLSTVASQDTYDSSGRQISYRGIYLTPPDTTGCGLIKFANGTGPTCTAC